MATNIERSSDVLQAWKQHTLLANEYFHSERNLAALHHYRQAIEAAETLMHQHTNFPEAVQTYLISYQNMADLYVKQNEPSLAQWELGQILDALSIQLDQLDASSDKCGILLKAIGQLHMSLLLAEKNNAGRNVTQPKFDTLKSNIKHKLN